MKHDIKGIKLVQRLIVKKSNSMVGATQVEANLQGTIGVIATSIY